MVVPTAGHEPASRQRSYAEAPSRVDAVSAQSLHSKFTVGLGRSCGLVAVCSNNALEYAAAYGLRRTAKPPRVLSAAQRQR